jgi:hypothetical protein
LIRNAFGRRRLLLLAGSGSDPRQPVLLTEFGGIAYALDQQGWGYSRALSEKGFLVRYAGLLRALNESEDLAGFCYTQLADTYQEINGLLTDDRQFKVDPGAIAIETSRVGQSCVNKRQPDLLFPPASIT